MQKCRWLQKCGSLRYVDHLLQFYPLIIDKTYNCDCQHQKRCFQKNIICLIKEINLLKNYK